MLNCDFFENDRINEYLEDHLSEYSCDGMLGRKNSSDRHFLGSKINIKSSDVYYKVNVQENCSNNIFDSEKYYKVDDEFFKIVYNQKTKNSISNRSNIKTDVSYLVNPQDNDGIVCSSKIDISFYSKISKSETKCWDLFYSSGASIEKIYENTYDLEDFRRHAVRYNVTLFDDQEYGFVQFIQLAKDGCTVRTDSDHYEYSEIINVFVFPMNRGADVQTISTDYPPVLTVIPSSKQIFAPILIGQKIQIIVPNRFTLQNNHQNCIKLLHSSASHGYTIYTLKTTSEVMTNLYLFVSHKDDHRCIVLPPIISEQNGRNCLLHEPMLDSAVLYCNNIDGFILSTQKSLDIKPAAFLDDRGEFWVESVCHFQQANSSYGAYRVAVKIKNTNREVLSFKEIFTPNV